MSTVESASILIVGAGQAGGMAAAALRGFGCGKRIVVAGAEASPPYERPPLSKGLLAGKAEMGQILVHPIGFHAEKDIALKLGRNIAKLDVANRIAHLADGGQLHYEHCVIATGGIARGLPGLPADSPRVHQLRTVADALRLKEALLQAKTVLIVGGGFLGLEVASTARGLGLGVAVLEGAPRLLARVLPESMSFWLREQVVRSGVDLRDAAQCTGYAVDANGVTASFIDGQTLSADLVVVAVGMDPNVALARDAGIAISAVNGGIRVGADCQTSRPGHYAAGDCASQVHPFVGAELRIESWQNANEQARIAAAAIVGAQTASLPTPWFWSDQFGFNLQVLGSQEADLIYQMRGVHGESDGPAKFLVMGVNAGGRIRHAIAINAGGDLRQIKPLVDGQIPCDIDALCDLSKVLRQQVKVNMGASLAPANS